MKALLDGTTLCWLLCSLMESHVTICQSKLDWGYKDANSLLGGFLWEIQMNLGYHLYIQHTLTRFLLAQMTSLNICVCVFAINSLIITQKNQTNEYTEIMHLIRLQEESKMMFRTWNHLAWRRTARASRHFCLSKTSTGSFTIPEVTSKNEFQVSKWWWGMGVWPGQRGWQRTNTLPHIPASLSVTTYTCFFRISKRSLTFEKHSKTLMSKLCLQTAYSMLGHYVYRLT